jgi:DegV family protein with EDD domain
VKIIMDSTADVPEHLLQELNISVIPIKVQMGEEVYTPGVNLTTKEFYQKLKEIPDIPTTSQPTPLDYQELYHQAIAEGAKEIISIHLSSAMSGTYQAAVLAAREVEEEKGVTIKVIDSRSASYGIGIAVVAAARAAKAGKSLQECVEIAEYYLRNQKIFFLVDTLEYLQKGGRIGKAASVVGSLLNIKPILSINEEGFVCAVDKVRGRNKAVNRVFELLKEAVPQGPVSAAVFHANVPEEAEQWMARIKEDPYFELKEAVITEIGPIIGTHAGPGTVAVVMVPWKEW